MNYVYIHSENLDTARLLIDKAKILDAFQQTRLTRDNLDFLRGFAEELELELMIHWNEQSNLSEEDQGPFKELAKYLYEILMIQGPGEQANSEILHNLKLISYAYIGEHGEKMRRVATELLNSAPSDYSSKWSERVLQKTYVSILHLIRKKGWNDLSETIAIINSLRDEQGEYESQYLNTDDTNVETAGMAYEIASLYHLAKAVEIVADFQLDGRPANADEELSLQLDYASRYSEQGGLIELTLLIKILEGSLRKIVSNSIWIVGQRINSRVTKFLNSMKNRKPMLELLYPQKDAILNQGLLDPAHSAIVVNLPTSSGKTLVAEFKILQSLNQFDDAWVAYVAPTKALVNQVTRRLRDELGQEPLGLKVESMSGAVEVDSYEEVMITNHTFDVLVTTPEKLNLLIRRGIEESMGRPLALVVVDEAHNISSDVRGINLELLLSNIRHDCQNANMLLLTPFIPNSDEIARWLAPEASRSISLSLDWWKPNDQLIGAVELGEVIGRQSAETKFTPLITSRHTLQTDDIYRIGKSPIPYTASSMKSNYRISALAAVQFDSSADKLVIANHVEDTYKIADEIIKLGNLENQDSEDLRTIKKFVSDELGDDFPLVEYLSKGIGVHHSALPDEIKSMMEYLMENGELRYLVATTTIAQGINFNTPSIFMSTYSYPYKQMPYFDFWNLAGRSGRLNQDAIGVVGISCKNEDDVRRLRLYLSSAATDIVSNLKDMVEKAIKRTNGLDLASLYFIPEWSNFLQYIAHMYNQAENLRNFETQIQLTMKRTLGFHQLEPDRQQLLLESVRTYAAKLDTNKGASTLSDLTGFSPETIQRTMSMAHQSGISASDWNSNSLFHQDSNSLKKLVNIMLSIPEIKKDLEKLLGDSPRLSNGKIANMISDWVGGKSMNQMADEYFSEVSDSTLRLTMCVKAVHRHLINSTTWGMAAIQRSASGIDFEALSDSDKKKLAELPAMVYYGVDTTEAIALRKARLPRAASKSLSNKLKRDFGDTLYEKTGSEIENWVNSLDDRDWAVTANGQMSGEDNKRIWEILKNT